MHDIAEQNCQRLHRSEYPGRGIIMGFSPSGKYFIQLYWTMGRSASSQNRRLICDNNIVKTVKIGDESEMKKPNLLLYNATSVHKQIHVVTNGEQTDTIYDFIKRGKTFEEALLQWHHEDDPPINTPRISGIVDLTAKDRVVYKFGIIAPVSEQKENSSYHISSYSETIPGYGLCMHTYELDDLCMPFMSRPYAVLMYDDIDTMTEYYWSLISNQYRVGIYVKYIDLETDEMQEKIVNNQ